MLVSVIVPVYKVEKYLKNCIDSILQQTYKDFELILVDDGSPDDCGRICDSYAQRDSRIVVIHQKNGGLSNARNSGINVARGSFLFFVDSDDFILPQCLDILVKESIDKNADMVVCSYCRCEPCASLVDVRSPANYFTDVFSSNKMEVFLTTKKIGTTAWGKLYKKELFRQLRYPDGKYNEDVFTTYIAVHEANKVVSCSYIGYVYRENQMSIMNEPFSDKKIDSIEGCVCRANFISQYYPCLACYANRSIVYACNQVLLCMGRSGVVKHDYLSSIQFLIRKNLTFYLFSNVSLFGKIFALLSSISVKLSIWLVRIFKI